MMKNKEITIKDIDKNGKTFHKHLNDYLINIPNGFWNYDEVYQIVRIDVLMLGVEIAENFYSVDGQNFDKKGYTQYLTFLKDEWYKQNSSWQTSNDDRGINNFVNGVMELKKELNSKGIDRKEIHKIAGEIVCEQYNILNFYKNKYQPVILMETDNEVRNKLLKQVYKKIEKEELITSPDKNSEKGYSSHPFGKPPKKDEKER